MKGIGDTATQFGRSESSAKTLPSLYNSDWKELQRHRYTQTVQQSMSKKFS